MSASSKAICLIISVLLLAPVTLADLVIENGPSVKAASNGAFAVGGPYLITDDSSADGVYWAVMGLHALAVVPGAEEGYATVSFEDYSNTYDKTIDLLDTTTHGDTPRFHLTYSGDVYANVYKTTPTTAPAVAYANIGTGAADFAFDNGAGDADDTIIGAAGQLSLLSLPNNAMGSAGTSGIAAFNVMKIGDTVMGPNGITSDEVLEAAGIANGNTGIGGVGDDQYANNRVLGLSALGTLTIARDIADGFPPAGEAGQSITASGMATLTAAATGASNLDADIEAVATSNNVLGYAWDGSTPLGTIKMPTSTASVYSEVSGSASSLAQTFEDGDVAAAGSLIGDIAFHTGSPLTLPYQLAPETSPTMMGALSGEDEAFGYLDEFWNNGVDGDVAEALGLITEELGENAGDALMQAGEQVDTQLFEFMPQFDWSVGAEEIQQGEEVLGQTLDDPDMVALDIAVTGALAQRTQFGLDNHVSAEAYLTDVDAAAVTRLNDRKVSVAKENMDLASGAHLENGADLAGSLGFVADVAAQDNTAPIFPTTGTFGTGSIYGAVTLAPPVSGARWDDAGSLMNLDSATMESSRGSKYVRQTDGPVEAITWMAGNDMNPRINGQLVPVTIADSESGNPATTTQVVAPLAYFEDANGRASVWVTATGTLQD